MISTTTKFNFAGILIFAAVCMLYEGCSGNSFVKTNVKGPYIEDNLADGSSVGVVDNGEFVSSGWKPGTNGSISYNIPGVAQGYVEIEATGLNRSTPTSPFLTMYEPADSEYADPFVLKNPFRILVSMKNFQESPRSPFEFLWTIKRFPSGTTTEGRYVDGIPAGGDGYEQTMAAAYAPVFPDQTYRIRIEWKNGLALLYLDGELLARHAYRPHVFDPQAIQVVVGKSPGLELFDFGEAVISKVVISFPGV